MLLWRLPPVPSHMPPPPLLPTLAPPTLRDAPAGCGPTEKPPSRAADDTDSADDMDASAATASKRASHVAGCCASGWDPPPPPLTAARSGGELCLGDADAPSGGAMKEEE